MILEVIVPIVVLVVLAVGYYRLASAAGKGLVQIYQSLVRDRGSQSRPCVPGTSYLTGLPFNCPVCGRLLGHLVCSVCGAKFTNLDQCPKCGLLIGTITCLTCKATMQVTKVQD